MSKRTLLLVILCWPMIAPINPEEAPPATLQSVAPAVSVTLSQSVVALYGPWKFHIGDNRSGSIPISTIQTGKPST